MARILIAIEDASLFGLIQYKLSKSGYDVTGAFDGVQALNLLQSETYDALLLDLMLPKTDGYQIMRELQDGRANRPRVIIIVTTRGEEEDILRAFEFGAVDYVAKPFSLNVLAARLEIALRYKSLLADQPAAVAPAAPVAASGQAAGPMRTVAIT